MYRCGPSYVVYLGCFSYTEFGLLVDVTAKIKFGQLVGSYYLLAILAINRTFNTSPPGRQLLHPLSQTVVDYQNEHWRLLLHLDWLAKSPDLNHIKSFWDHHEQQINHLEHHWRYLTKLIWFGVTEWILTIHTLTIL